MAVRNPDIIRAGRRGVRPAVHRAVSTQVKHVGVRDGIPSGYEVFIDGARLATGLDALDWVRRGEDLGAGEIVVNSIDRDGTASGYDLDITRAVADAVNVPGDRVGRRRAPSTTSPTASPPAARRPRSSARSSTRRGSSGTSASAS